MDLDSHVGRREADARTSKLNPAWDWNGEGVIFCTYTLLSRSINQKEKEDVLHVERTFGFPSLQSNGTDQVVDLDVDPVDIEPSENCVSIKVATRLGQLLKLMSRAPPKSSSALSNGLSKYLKRHSSEGWKEPYWRYYPDKFVAGGLLCFDEAHKAKNLVFETDSLRPTKQGTSTGQTVKILQDLLKHCPVS